MRRIKVSKGKAVFTLLVLVLLTPVIYGWITDTFTKPGTDDINILGVYALVAAVIGGLGVFALIIVLAMKLDKYIKSNW